MTDKTKKYMKSVKESLKARYGKIEPEWQGILDSLERTYDFIQLVYEEIVNQGVLIQESNGNKTPNKLIATLFESQKLFDRFSQQLGLSPQASDRLNSTILNNKKTKIRVEEKQTELDKGTVNESKFSDYIQSAVEDDDDEY